MAIQAKYDATRGLNENLDSAGSAEFHVAGVGISSPLQVNRHHVIKIVTVADSAALYKSSISISDTTTTYRLFFNRAAPNDADVPPGMVNVELSNDAAGMDDADTVATVLEGVIEALGGAGAAFASAVANGNEITVSCNIVGPTLAAHDMGTAGITATVESAGVGSTVLKTSSCSTKAISMSS